MVRNFQIEERQCRLRLGEVLGDTLRAIRSELRDKICKNRKTCLSEEWGCYGTINVR